MSLYSLLALALAGLVGGFLSSAPVGVINIWVAEQILSREASPTHSAPRPQLQAFIAGVVTADMLFAALAAWGYQAFLEGSQFSRVFEIAGGVLILVLGIAGFRRQLDRSKPDGKAIPALAANDGKPIRSFALGAVLCGSNPAFLMFWVFVVQVVEGTLDIDPGLAGILLFVLAVGIGDLAWFRMLHALVDGGRNSVRESSLGTLRKVFAAIFILAGSGVIAKGLQVI